MQLKTQLKVVFGGVFILLVLLHHFTGTSQTTGVDPQSKTSLRSSGTTTTQTASQQMNGTEIRISSVWVVRETPSTLEVFINLRTASYEAILQGP